MSKHTLRCCSNTSTANVLMLMELAAVAVAVDAAYCAADGYALAGEQLQLTDVRLAICVDIDEILPAYFSSISVYTEFSGEHMSGRETRYS
eukprot:21367-Heterococcus_DN1.PRE.8